MTKKMAIVVIHGMGEQKPFETLDAFAQGLEKEYHARGIKAALKHDLVWFGGWGESCISLIPEDGRHKQIDIFEYYWAHMTQRKITAEEVTDWIFKVGQGGAKSPLYGKGKIRGSNYTLNEALFNKDGELKLSEYLAQMMCISKWAKPFFKLLLKALPYLRKLHPIFSTMGDLPYLGTAKKALDALSGFLKGLLSRVMVDYIGDIALYCTADVKSQYYDTRMQILNGAADKVKLLAMNDSYDEILLCGHSLGSIIVYDVIDRINRLMQHDIALRGEKNKFKGIVTFGSPLDKVAFFFDEHVDRMKQPVRYSIVTFLHSFRRKYVTNPIPVEFQDDSGAQSRPVDVGTTIKPYLSDIPWLNFWTPFDVISGHLDVYKDVDNISLDFAPDFKLSSLSKMKLFVASHTHYWKSKKLYQDIVSKFIQPVSHTPHP